SGAYESALAGQRSVGELTRLIERTMPQEHPEECTGDEAQAVAAYIYDEFYSLAARQRKGLDPPLHVELMRLTVPQYLNSVADLLAHFTPEVTRQRRGNKDASPDTDGQQEPGLHATYYRSKGMSKADQLSFERTDTRLEFDFHEAAPAEDIPVDQFAIVWTGAIDAAETGEYQFRITTPNGARLYLNNDPGEGRGKLRDDSSVAGQAALIDAWVSSRKLRTESARAFLLGGRRYPLRVEFFKYQEPTASIKVEWKPPHGTWTVLNSQVLTSANVGRTFVVETPFPADDRSLGYERGSAISNEWLTAVTSAAVATAEEVVNRIDLLSRGLKRQSDDGKDMSEADARASFVREFASVAFRRELTDQEANVIKERFFVETESPEAGLRQAIVWVMCSPEFLYTDLCDPQQSRSATAAAQRMSFALWDSLPNDQLRAAVTGNQLNTPEQLEAMARAMLSDARTKHKLRSFFHHWLELDDRDLSKDRELFPEFDEQTIAALRESLEQFLDNVAWSDASDYRELMAADYLLLNHRLAAMYGPTNSLTEDADTAGPAEQANATDDDAYERVVFDDQQRAGVLTHPYLLSAFAYHNNTSPIHRGVFLTRNVVGRALKPPPIAVAFKNDEFAADLTMREKITQLTSDSACMACHSVINPLGFALENYDAVGRWRTIEKTKPIDTHSAYTTENGERIDIANARDIAQLALSSESAHRAFVVQLFEHMTKQTPAAYGPNTAEELRAAFEADQYNIQNLMVRIAVLAAEQGPVPAVNSTAATP
ncbi:MAG: DUF1592 domain-containing protein, partial [Planctomycetales bacterium]|nr:DUF1592 domain-containing protein [Planctomycetales bacterium]